jgi:hypothetical protein
MAPVVNANVCYKLLEKARRKSGLRKNLGRVYIQPSDLVCLFVWFILNLLVYHSVLTGKQTTLLKVRRCLPGRTA